MKNLKSNFFAIAIMFVFIAIIPAANAAVTSILDAANTSPGSSRPYRPKTCQERGFNTTSCSDNKSPKNFCPTDKKYFKSCVCNSSLYKYDRSNCNENKLLKGKTCDNKYEFCVCDENKYTYTRKNCEFPKVLDGKSCDNIYENCKCPEKFSKECKYPLVGASRGCDNFYTDCKCAPNFKYCPKGHDIDAEICIEQNGNIKYNKCL